MPATPDESATRRPTACRVLYTDAEQSMRFVVSLLLRQHGYDVETASSGTEAWTKLTTVRPAFAILMTEWMLPDMGGVQLIQRARMAGFAGRIIVVSSPIEHAQQVTLNSVGVDATITKTCGPDELVAILARLSAVPAAP